MADWRKRKELHRVAMDVLGHTDEERLAHMKFEPVVDEIWELTQDTGLFSWYSSPMYAYSCVDCACDFAMGYARMLANWLEQQDYRTTLPNTNAKAFNVKRVLDYGAGIGASTRLLAEMLPDVEVMYNAYDTYCNAQVKVAKRLFHGLREDSGRDVLYDLYAQNFDPSEWKPNAVLFFDVLEHERKPFEVVQSYMKSRACRVIVMANSFTQPEDLGHWKDYIFEGSMEVPRKDAAKVLRRLMREAGWKVTLTGFWNNRPEIWVRA
jgi:predicted O-methyltransferase YrrM